MAGAIKGITIEFGADVTNLNNALKKTNGALSATQQEIRSIDRALKFNPGNTTLLKQKFDLLKRAVSETETKMKQLKDMQKAMDAAGVDKTSAQYKQLEREIQRTEQELQKANADLKRFGSIGKQQALAVGNAFKTAGGKIKSAGRTITTSVSVYGAAGIYTGAKLIEMSEKQTQAENKLIEIYKTRMGVSKQSAKATMEYASALQKQGVIGDEVTLSGAQQLATFAKYPSTVNALLPAMDNLLVQQKGLNATQDDAKNIANLFGKAMMGQTGALRRVGISFDEEQEKVLKFGTEEEKAAMLAEVVTDNVGNMNAEFAKNDDGKIQQAKNTLGDMGEQIGAVLLPAVANLATWIGENLLPKIQTLIGWLQQHPKVATFALAIAGITAAIGPLIIILGSFVSMIGGVISIAAVVGPALAAVSLPILGIVAAIAAAIAIGVALYKNWDKIKAAAAALKAKVTAQFNALKSGVTKTFNAIKTAITKPITTAFNTVKKVVDRIKKFFPLKIGKIFKGMKLPHFSVKGKAPFGIGGKGVKPGISVQWYKKAMQQPYMFSNATLFGAGEKGDEMLYGRSRLMKDIAQAVGSNMNGLTVNVYGSDNMSVEDLADAVERRLITMQKRRTQAWA